MSASASSSRAPGFLWLLAAFVGIFVILALIPKRETIDPRAPVREKNTDDIKAAQQSILAKMGLVPGKSTETLEKGLASIKGDAARPGPKIQAAPAPAPAPSPAPAAGAAPAAAPAK